MLFANCVRSGIDLLDSTIIVGFLNADDALHEVVVAKLQLLSRCLRRDGHL